MEYRHLKSLGNPRDLRHRLRRDRDTSAWGREFEARLDGQGDALGEAAEIVRRGGACLLCYERDPEKCHRARVAARLRALTGAEVMHL